MKTYSKLWLVKTVLSIAALTATILIPGAARAAGPWYVTPTGNDSYSCLSAGNPCASINAAIGKATFGDTIFVATGTYTKSIGSEVVFIDKSITLSGGWNAAFTTQSGASTIDGQEARRGITVYNGMIVIIDRFVIQNGSASGNNSETGRGGGISLFNGTLTLNNSTVSGNTSNADGGGIANYSGGTLTLNNSTVNGNTQSNGNGGGGIYLANGTLTLNNSTVSGNTSRGGYGGGILSYNNLTTLNNSTVSGNTSLYNYGVGGGIYIWDGAVTLQNSLLAGNTAYSSPDCHGTISSSGYNLIGNTSNCTFNASTGDLLNINPILFPLTWSLGVQVHPLLPWSPAVNTGNPAGCTDNLGIPLNTDQRGIARVGRCDIGAYEYDPNNDPLTYIFLPLIMK